MTLSWRLRDTTLTFINIHSPGDDLHVLGI